MSAATVRTFTPLGEYLALEAASVGQRPNLEYDGNDIVFMAGASENRGLIATALSSILRAALLPRGCRTVGGDLRVKAETSYRYPDIVAYGPPTQFTDERPPSLLHPLLIVEVLSETTAHTDLVLKLQEYTSIESMQEYWVVSQEAPVLYRYARAAEAWQVHIHRGMDAAFTSGALQVSVRLADVYDGVDLSPAPDDAGSRAEQ